MKSIRIYLKEIVDIILFVTRKNHQKKTRMILHLICLENDKHESNFFAYFSVIFMLEIFNVHHLIRMNG